MSLPRLCFLSYRAIREFARPVLDEYADRARIEAIDGSFERTLAIARDRLARGQVDAFVSAGSNASLLRRHLQAPVSTIQLTGFDILQALLLARARTTRVGIVTKVDTMPSAVYFTRANKLEFSLMLVGWGSDTAEASSPLKALLATFNNDKGMGQANRGRYSSAKLDALLEQALATVDDARREKLLQEATQVGMSELGIITLYHQENLWATRKGVVYTPRADERTFAHEFRAQ